MPSRTRQLAENSLMLGTAAILLFLYFYTFLGNIFLFVLPVPFILLAVRRKWQDMIVVAVIYAVLGMIIMSYQGALLALMISLIGTVMGLLYKKRTTAMPAILCGAGMWFLSIAAGLALLTFVFNVNVVEQIRKFGHLMASDQIVDSLPRYQTKQQWKEQIYILFDYLIIVLPAGFVMVSFMFSIVNHWIARIIGKRLDRFIPALKPFHEWSFPRTLLLYYFVCLLLVLYGGSSLETTGWGKAVLNLNMILSWIFLIQGLSLSALFFIIKGWKKFVPPLFIALFIFPLLTNILSLLGIIDLGMGLRQRLQTRK